MSDLELASPDSLPRIAAELEAADRVAVDTEFHAERRYFPQLLLLQIHVPGATTWLIDPLIPGMLEAVAAPLRATPWLVHAGRQDLRLLERALGGVAADVVDTQVAAGLASPVYPAAFTELLRDWCAVTVDKSATLSDWSRRPLGAEQLTYAADDVRMLPGLWDALQQRLLALDRLDLATAAFAEARASALRPADRDLLWTELPASTMLDGPGRSVLQELCRWRDEEGEATDTPARSVLGDGLAVDLAKRRPASVNRILSNRRFPRKLAQRIGDDLVALIERAAGRPEWGWPAVIRPQTPEQRTADFLRLVAQTSGAENGFSARLVLPERRLSTLVLDPPTDRDALDQVLGSWRQELLGGLLWDAFRGAVRVDMFQGAPRLDTD